MGVGISKARSRREDLSEKIRWCRGELDTEIRTLKANGSSEVEVKDAVTRTLQAGLRTVNPAEVLAAVRSGTELGIISEGEARNVMNYIERYWGPSTEAARIVIGEIGELFSSLKR